MVVGGGPKMHVHCTSIFGEPQEWMFNPASILQIPAKAKREESGHFGHGSEVKLPKKPGFPLVIAPHTMSVA